MNHPCKLIYQIGGEQTVYGNEEGICRITGEKSKGLKFNKWVRNTFNDYDRLVPGNIISNEALFCFDESSEIIQKKVGKEKRQRFRTYNHIIANGEWYCLTKAEKKLIFKLISEGAELVCLTDTGQKHVLFKHKRGFWQLDELFIKPDIETLKFLHKQMCELLTLGFSQTEIITGNYISARIFKAGIKEWRTKEELIKRYRGSRIFNFTSFMLFTES